jgi:hypothetical protein
VGSGEGELAATRESMDGPVLLVGLATHRGLGRMPKRVAQQRWVYMKRLVECRKLGVVCDGETARWLASL